ncbi:MAG TPA: phosphonate ABC transporter permease [Clostridiales bacterium]|nr:phosphonate ABC transporter permease [Clostridiales bacterium]
MRSVTTSPIRRHAFSTVTSVVLGLFFLVSVLLPLISVMTNLRNADIPAIFSHPQTVPAIFNSVKVSLTATVLSIAVAFVAAWCVNRSGIRHRELFNLLLVIPMLIPSISHGTGLIILWGDNGILTRLLGLSRSIYGFWGIVFGSVMYAFPIAYLMIADILQYEDKSPYEAAQVLGIPKKNRFAVITLPYLKKPMISVVFAVFTTIITDYGVPLMVGGMYKTLPVLMYEETIHRMNYAKGSVFGLLLLLPALVAFLFDLLSGKDKLRSVSAAPFAVASSRRKRVIAYAILAVIVIAVLLPILSFIPVALAENYPLDMGFSFDRFSEVMGEKDGWHFLGNSVLVALLVATIGTLCAFFCAYLTARVKSPVSAVLNLLAITSLAIPGIVLGLSYVLFFRSSFLYGTFAILVLVNIIHFFASPYLMVYNSLGKLPAELETVGATLGIGKFRMLRDVIAPQVKGTLLEMFSYFFINSMMTISAVSFLTTIDTDLFALMLPKFDASQTSLAPPAIVALIILLVNLLMKGAISLLKHLLGKRRTKSRTAA